MKQKMVFKNLNGRNSIFMLPIAKIILSLNCCYFMYHFFLSTWIFRKKPISFFQENLIDVKMNDNPFIDDSGSRYFELELNT